jgi:hypothetical protein
MRSIRGDYREWNGSSRGPDSRIRAAKMVDPLRSREIRAQVPGIHEVKRAVRPGVIPLHGPKVSHRMSDNLPVGPTLLDNGLARSA